MKRLLKFALVGGVIAAVVRAAAGRKREWHGLTETEVRDKLASRLPESVPDEKRALISDKVVAKMRKRGVLREQ